MRRLACLSTRLQLALRRSHPPPARPARPAAANACSRHNLALVLPLLVGRVGGLVSGTRQGPRVRVRWGAWDAWARCNSNSAVSGVEEVRSGPVGAHDQTSVQWLSFVGFYQKKIIKDFCQSATQHSLTGFLAHGKPSVACLEGTAENIKEFLRHVRTVVFATVPRNARKMTLGLREPNLSCTTRPPRFGSFVAKAFFSQGAHHRPDMLDRTQLDVFLRDQSVPEDVRNEVLKFK